MTRWMPMVLAIVLMLSVKDDFHFMLITFLVLAFTGMVSWIFLRWVYGRNGSHEVEMEKKKEEREPPEPMEERYVLPSSGKKESDPYFRPYVRSFEEGWMTSHPWVPTPPPDAGPPATETTPDAKEETPKEGPKE